MCNWMQDCFNVSIVSDISTLTADIKKCAETLFCVIEGADENAFLKHSRMKVLTFSMPYFN